jgi:acetyltransferase-like isoleucine patch superfamily enzyme
MILRIKQFIKSFLIKNNVNPPSIPTKSKWDNPCIHFDSSSILTDMANLRFDVPRKKNDICLRIGEKSILNCNFIFESSDGGFIQIGDRTYIGPGTNIISRKKISIGSDVVIAWGCYIYDHNSHSLDWQDRVEDVAQVEKDLRSTGNQIMNKNWDTVASKEIVIHDKVWIGFEAVIMKGVQIGEGAIIGARSVVREDVEPFTVVAGNPAKLIRRLERK